MDLGHLLDAIPVEIRGFVIAIIVTQTFIVMFQLLRNIRRPVDAASARLAASRAKGRKTSPRDRAKAREAALAQGFMVDDVERDMPDFEGGSMLRRGYCADYYLPERAASSADWTLFCRPGEFADSLPAGRVFRLGKGLPSDALSRAIAAIANDLGTPDDFFEIEARDSFLHFYWDESDGKAGVTRIKSYFDKLKSIP